MKKLQEFKCPHCGNVFEDIVEDGVEQIMCDKCRDTNEHGIVQRYMARKVRVCQPKHAKNSSWKVS